MMATVDDLMKRSLRMLVIAGAESDVSGADADDYITELNALADEYESFDSVTMTGVSTTNWTAVDSTSDTLTSPASIFHALAVLMAVRMAPDYGVTVTPELQRQANEADSQVLRVCTTRTSGYKPGTLPLGSGNEGNSQNYINGRFYSGAE